MKLFSKEIDKKLFSQYSKGSDLDNQVVVTKIFNPYGNGRWFLLNSDPQDPDYLWAIVQMGDVVEMGSVLRSELESVRVSPFRFPLERDLSFRMVNAGELFRGLQEGKFYKKGGWVDGYAKGGHINDLDIDSLVGKKLDDGKIIRVEDLGNDNIWVVRENFSGLVIEQGFTKDDIIKLTKGEKVEGLKMMAQGGELNLGIRKIAEQEGFTPKQLGKEYELVMAQAIVESLTDANFHNEARKLISLLENKPEWENKPEYGTKEYEKWEKSGVYNSKYWDADEKTRDFAIKVSQKSGWDGYAIASAFEYLVRIDGGYHKLADKIEKAMESNEKMAKGGGIYTSDSLYYLQVIKDDKEVAREKFRAKSLKEAKEISEDEYEEDYIKKFGNPLNFIVSEAMAEGGEVDSEAKRIADNPNWTNDKLKAEYDSLKKDLQNFNSGLLKPSKVIGTGYKSSAIAKRLAKKWLEDNIAKYEKALEIRGVMAKGGKLIGNQKKLDVNKNGKLDAQDFKMLRGKMAMGGKVKFADKVKEVKASLLKRKKVSPKVQKDYGKTYSPKEAEQSAKRIVGAQVKKYEVKKK